MVAALQSSVQRSRRSDWTIISSSTLLKHVQYRSIQGTQRRRTNNISSSSCRCYCCSHSVQSLHNVNLSAIGRASIRLAVLGLQSRSYSCATDFSKQFNTEQEEKGEVVRDFKSLNHMRAQFSQLEKYLGIDLPDGHDDDNDDFKYDYEQRRIRLVVLHIHDIQKNAKRNKCRSNDKLNNRTELEKTNEGTIGLVGSPETELLLQIAKLCTIALIDAKNSNNASSYLQKEDSRLPIFWFTAAAGVKQVIDASNIFSNIMNDTSFEGTILPNASLHEKKCQYDDAKCVMQYMIELQNALAEVTVKLSDDASIDIDIDAPPLPSISSIVTSLSKVPQYQYMCFTDEYNIMSANLFSRLLYLYEKAIDFGRTNSKCSVHDTSNAAYALSQAFAAVKEGNVSLHIEHNYRDFVQKIIAYVRMNFIECDEEEIGFYEVPTLLSKITSSVAKVMPSFHINTRIQHLQSIDMSDADKELLNSYEELVEVMQTHIETGLVTYGGSKSSSWFKNLENIDLVASQCCKNYMSTDHPIMVMLRSKVQSIIIDESLCGLNNLNDSLNDLEKLSKLLQNLSFHGVLQNGEITNKLVEVDTKRILDVKTRSSNNKAFILSLTQILVRLSNAGTTNLRLFDDISLRIAETLLDNEELDEIEIDDHVIDKVMSRLACSGLILSHERYKGAFNNLCSKKDTKEGFEDYSVYGIKSQINMFRMSKHIYKPLLRNWKDEDNFHNNDIYCPKELVQHSVDKLLEGRKPLGVDLGCGFGSFIIGMCYTALFKKDALAEQFAKTKVPINCNWIGCDLSLHTITRAKGVAKRLCIDHLCSFWNDSAVKVISYLYYKSIDVQHIVINFPTPVKKNNLNSSLHSKNDFMISRKLADLIVQVMKRGTTNKKTFLFIQSNCSYTSSSIRNQFLTFGLQIHSSCLNPFPVLCETEAASILDARPIYRTIMIVP